MIDEEIEVSAIIDLMKKERKNQNLIRKLFTMKGWKNGNKQIEGSFDSSGDGGCSDSSIESLLFRGASTGTSSQNAQPCRVFVATWNVGGKSPPSNLDLDDILQVHYQSDIYVLGLQEIVPLNAGNVLVIEDNEPAGKWLALINQSLNKQTAVKGRKSTASLGGSLFFQKQSLRKISNTFRTESKRRLKSCNCAPELEKKYSKEFCFRCPQAQSNISEGEPSSEEDEDGSTSFPDITTPLSANQMNYGLVASKQMVGIFVTIWMRKELIQHVSHLRISCVSRGLMGCLGNKGCIAVSMYFHQTSFCFVCSHLASGQKEGDELRRNSDVIEILKNTQFPRICRTSRTRVPDKIQEHNRVIWLGDLNYRIALSYSETRKLLQENNWDALLSKDQLKIERDAERVFKGWYEGKIYFAPTYKYSFNSDIYAGETVETRNKRRTPAWCDRILWHGDGIYQLSYVRGENRFSDHRPVYATFLVDVEVTEGGIGRKLSGPNMKVGIEELLPTTSM